MKFSSSVLVALFLFFVAVSASVVDATTRDETSDGLGRPSRRTLVTKKNPSAAVAAAKPYKLMFLQAGTDCALTPSATSGEYLFRATVGTATTYFSERPDRLAGTMATQTFVGNFEDPYFVTSNPNVAITFSGNNSSNTGPLIVVLSRPHMVSSSIIEYTMTQSSSQGEVASIDQFMETSGSCSIFIDVVYHVGPITNRTPCLPAVGKFGGNSTTTNGADNPFETCYKYGSKSKYCWSKSFYSGSWYQCTPTGDEMFSGWYAVDNDDMKYVNPVTHPYSCGDPCQKFQ